MWLALWLIGCGSADIPTPPTLAVDAAWTWLPEQGQIVHSQPDRHVVELTTEVADEALIRWQAAASTTGWWLRAHRKATIGVTMRFNNRQGEELALGVVHTPQGALLSATNLSLPPQRKSTPDKPETP